MDKTGKKSPYEHVPHHGQCFEENGRTFVWIMGEPLNETVRQWQVYTGGSSGIQAIELAHWRWVEQEQFLSYDDNENPIQATFGKKEILEGNGTVKHASFQYYDNGQWKDVPKEERQALYIINTGRDYSGIPSVKRPQYVLCPLLAGETFGNERYLSSVEKDGFQEHGAVTGENNDLLFMGFTYKGARHDFSLVPPEDDSPVAGSDWIGSKPLSHELWQAILPDVFVDQSDEGFVVDVDPEVKSNFVTGFNEIAKGRFSIHLASDAEIDHLNSVMGAFSKALKSYEGPFKTGTLEEETGIVFDRENESRYMRLVLDS